MTQTSKLRRAESQDPYSGSREVRRERAVVATTHVLPRVVLVGLFLGLAITAIWMLLNDQPLLGAVAVAGALVALARDTMRSLKTQPAPVVANGCPHQRYVSWEFRDRG